MGLCDQLYDKYSSGTQPRTSHRVKTISIIKKHLPEIVYSIDSEVKGAEIPFEEQCFDFLNASTGIEHQEFGTGSGYAMLYN